MMNNIISILIKMTFSLNDIIGDIKTNAKNLGNQLGNFVSNVGSKIEGTIGNIIGYAEKDGGAILTGFKDSADKIVDKVYQTQNNIVTSIKDVAVHGEDTVGGIANTLSWPLVALAGVAGLFLLKK
jgi:hypothetical protein